jgi:hypothetical protein
MLALFSAAAMSGCGGGGGGGVDGAPAPAPAAAAAPAPAPAASVAPATQAPLSSATSAANCPAGVSSLNMSNSLLAGANTSVKNGSTVLSFKTPLTVATVKVCVVQRDAQAAFPAIPDQLSAVLKGAVEIAVLADGQFEKLSNMQIAVNHAFPAATPAENAAKNLVAYTPRSDGTWVRTVLATTHKISAVPSATNEVNIELTAPITAPGFLTIE